MLLPVLAADACALDAVRQASGTLGGLVLLPLTASAFMLQALDPTNPESIERDDFAISIANMDE